jgi:hypothetical protein
MKGVCKEEHATVVRMALLRGCGVLAVAMLSCGKRSELNAAERDVSVQGQRSALAAASQLPVPVVVSPSGLSSSTAATESAAPVGIAQGASVLGSALPFRPQLLQPVATAVGQPLGALAIASSAPQQMGTQQRASPPLLPLHAGKAADAGANPVVTHANGPHYTVDFVAPGNCAASSRCGASLTLRAFEGYHINDEFPYKFTATAQANVQLLGRDGNVFSKAGGEFAKTNATTALLSVPFQAAAPGTVKLSGSYKFSVCSEATCQVELVEVALEIPIR